MKHYIKLHILALAICLLITSSASCMPTASVSDQPSGSQTEPPPAVPLSLVLQEMTDYTVIYAAGGESWEIGFAKKLVKVIQTVTGVRLQIKSDAEVAYAPNTKEIVVGSRGNNRAPCYREAFDYQNGYAVYVSGERLIFEANCKTGAYFALYQWVYDQFGVDMESDENALEGLAVQALLQERDYVAAKKLASSAFPYLAASDAQWKIVYDGTYLSRCLAFQLQNELWYTAGIQLPVGKRSDAESERGGYLILDTDDSLENGAWHLAAQNSNIVISAGDYHGFTSAFSALSALRHRYGYSSIRNGFADAGDYTENLPKAEQYQTSRYAYDRRGEYRVMFYNALWGNGSATRYEPDGSVWFDVPIWDRDRLQLAMVAEYMPDVMGLQEMSMERRGYTVDGKGGWVAMLEALGYAEVVDPRVKNLYEVGEEIPGSAAFNGGVPATGYGTGGGTKVTVGDDTFYTVYNCTPLFYNTKTTKVVEAGYHWYVTQSEQSGTAASRALTWGVFESLKTGERYIVLTTHCTSHLGAYLGQAKEARAIADGLIGKYNCPVFFGGDFNGNTGDANYDYLVSEEGGFRSLQDWRDPETGAPIAAEYSSMSLTTHGYPMLDRENQVMMPGNADVSLSDPTEKNGNAIDQVFVDNTDALEVQVFGVVADFCSLRGSDHLPLLVDFSI